MLTRQDSVSAPLRTPWLFAAWSGSDSKNGNAIKRNGDTLTFSVLDVPDYRCDPIDSRVFLGVNLKQPPFQIESRFRDITLLRLAADLEPCARGNGAIDFSISCHKETSTSYRRGLRRLSNQAGPVTKLSPLTVGMPARDLHGGSLRGRSSFAGLRAACRPRPTLNAAPNARHEPAGVRLLLPTRGDVGAGRKSTNQSGSHYGVLVSLPASGEW